MDVSADDAVVVPDVITLGNAFSADPLRFRNRVRGEKFSRGMLYANSAVFFAPTADQAWNQCFNLCSFLDALILPRLIYFRANYMGIPGSMFEGAWDDEGAHEAARVRWEGVMDKTIRGFWIAVNLEPDFGEPYYEDVVEARRLFAEHWGSYWF